MIATDDLPPVLEGLNPPQRQAVTHESGPVLILAGPGSGKTRVITHRIAYLVRERSVPPWRILAVTFTNKAAREMRERSERLLGEDAHSLAMGTFHSLCARWLRNDGEAIGIDRNFVIYDDADQVALMRRILEEIHADQRRFTPRTVLGAISSAKSEMVTPEAYRLQIGSYFEDVVARAYAAYDRALGAASALDFDDLLNEAVRLFRESPPVLEKYAGRFLHVLVDEFQDTNPSQYLLARLLASVHRNITVVGDPDQGIYSWRAADIRNVQHFERDFPDCTVYLLEQNYRSTKPILAAADAVIARNRERKPRTLWTEREGGEAITLYEAYSMEEEGEFVATEVQRLRRVGIPLGHIAVMYRTNAQSRPIEDALVRHRIPYRLIGGVRFYERREIKDLIAYLRVIHNRLDEAALLRIINVPARGIGDRTIRELRGIASRSGTSVGAVVDQVAAGVQFAGISAKPAAAVKEFAETMQSLRDAMRSYLPDEPSPARGRGGREPVSAVGLPLTALLDEVLVATGYGAYLRDSEESEGRFENLKELRELMRQYEDTTGEGGDLAAFLQDASLMSDADTYENSDERMTLITLHAAKGLEFPVVFMVGLEEGLLPHLRSRDDERQMEEERRLAYVGMTRAMDRLYLSRTYRRWSHAGGAPTQPSRFLAEIPKGLLVPYGRQQRSTYEEAVTAPPREELPRPETDWTAGEKVIHPTFGLGTIVSVFDRRGEIELSIAFDGTGVKRIIASMTRLERA